MKYIIFDAGPLINFALNGLLPVLKKLKKEFKGEFLITKEVKKEIIDYPETIKRFELEALQLKDLFEHNIIKYANISEKQVDELRIKREEIINKANSTFFVNQRPLHIIDKGEAATLALSTMLKEPNVIVIDERTTRMLCENPENLRKIMQKKLHANVNAKKENYAYFKNFKVIRSTELAYIACKKNICEPEDPKILDAMLYGLKYKGCSISEQEIEEMKKI
jgi:predicted nucleic acid-binding protein